MELRRGEQGWEAKGKGKKAKSDLRAGAGRIPAKWKKVQKCKCCPSSPKFLPPIIELPCLPLFFLRKQWRKKKVGVGRQCRRAKGRRACLPPALGGRAGGKGRRVGVKRKKCRELAMLAFSNACMLGCRQVHVVVCARQHKTTASAPSSSDSQSILSSLYFPHSLHFFSP